MVDDKREKWIDATRGLLILLVVFGHASGTVAFLNQDSSTGSIYSGIFKVIYMFHMPAFFVLAGVTWSAGRDGFFSYAKKKIIRLLVPYFIFGLLSIVVGTGSNMFLGGGVISSDGYYSGTRVNSMLSELKKLLMGYGCSINQPLWFLPNMFVVEILYYWLMRLERFNCWRWCLPILLMVAATCYEALFGPDRMVRVLVFTLLLHLGRMIVSKQRLAYIANGSIIVRLLISSVFVIFLAACCFLPYEVQCSGVLSFVGFRLVAVIGSLLTIAISQCFPLKVFCVWGVSSLGILVMHKFPLAVIQLKLPSLFHGGCYFTLLLTSIVSLLTIVLCVLVSIFIKKWIPILLGENK